VHLMMASSAETCIVRKMGRDECFWCVNTSTKLHRDGANCEF
jgi:hypothetical protein